jgi:hypothetical protein
MSTNCTKWPQYRPSEHKIYLHLPFQDPQKFSQIGIFGLKICHLATLYLMTRYICKLCSMKSTFEVALDKGHQLKGEKDLDIFSASI